MTADNDRSTSRQFYWSIEFPELTQEQAERLAEFAEEKLGLSGWRRGILNDPRYFYSISMDRVTVETIRSGLVAINRDGYADNMIEDIDDWLRQAELLAPSKLPFLVILMAVRRPKIVEPESCSRRSRAATLAAAAGARLPLARRGVSRTTVYSFAAEFVCIVAALRRACSSDGNRYACVSRPQNSSGFPQLSTWPSRTK